MSSLLPLASLMLTVFTLLIFLRAALHKVQDFDEFQGFVTDYDLLPEKWIKPASMALVAAELGIVVMLLISTTRAPALLLAAALLMLYAAVMEINIRRGHTRIECGCGGAPQYLSRRLLVRNAVLALCALLPLSALPQGLATAEVLVSMAAAVVMFLSYLLIEQINANVLAVREMARQMKRI